MVSSLKFCFWVKTKIGQLFNFLKINYPKLPNIVCNIFNFEGLYLSLTFDACSKLLHVVDTKAKKIKFNDFCEPQYLHGVHICQFVLLLCGYIVFDIS